MSLQQGIPIIPTSQPLLPGECRGTEITGQLSFQQGIPIIPTSQHYMPGEHYIFLSLFVIIMWSVSIHFISMVIVVGMIGSRTW